MSEAINKSKKPRKKLLKLSDIEKNIKKLNTYKEYIIDKRTGEYVKYYEVFDEEKIEELLLELAEHMDYVKQNKINFFNTYGEIIEYIQYLCIKHFSHFKDCVNNEFESNMNLCTQLIKLGLYHKFMKEIYDPYEVAKVIERFHDKLDLIEKMNNLPKELLEEIKKMNHKNVLIRNKDKN